MQNNFSIKKNKIYRFGGRDIVLVITKEFSQPFYRSTGRNSGMKNVWLPFDGLGKYWGESPWFDKGRLIALGVANNLRIQRFGTEDFQKISKELSDLNLPEGEVALPQKINKFLEKKELAELYKGWSFRGKNKKYRGLVD